ncbi:hypothetical protein LTR62_001814 [Meristemomyces frigidus]|uniref:Uncharacterized protein n=1 Tax=Meristemomyces frigidus TaxID=1508187 RepID=A0AAN7TMX4_9PEZI|nr:hypothetical protein LTR62_001814 [Meristemomyces frigidus]
MARLHALAGAATTWATKASAIVVTKTQDLFKQSGVLLNRAAKLVQNINDGVVKQAATTTRGMRCTLRRAINILRRIKWRDIVKHIQHLIKTKPGVVAIISTSLLIAIFPRLFAEPMLAAMGFSGIGPVASSAAAGFQSFYGATALFAMFQSAAMGGYGIAAVYGAIALVAVAVAVAAVWCATCYSGKME